MLRIASIFLISIFLVNSTNAQRKPVAAVAALMGAGNSEGGSSSKGFQTVTASKIMEIKIPEGGANAAAVVYHPKEKLYYAAQCGNESFPLVIFDANGSIVSGAEQATLIDIRGLWYNPDTRKIGGNGYKEFGWFTYDLDRKGLPEKIDVFKQGRYQPDDHSPGVLNTDDNEVMFLDGLNIVCYTTEGVAKRKTIQIHIGSKNEEEGAGISATMFEENYNTRSLIYTGEEGAEIGLLNATKKQVELYNIKTGYMTKVVKLSINFKPETYFNFSYCNNTYWLFNKTSRIWHGLRE